LHSILGNTTSLAIMEFKRVWFVHPSRWNCPVQLNEKVSKHCEKSK